MRIEFLQRESIWLIGFGVFGLLLVASELGFQLARVVRPAEDANTTTELSVIQAALVTLALTIALVVTTIIDLDRPGQGSIRVSEQAMIDLAAHLRATGGH